MTLSSVLALAQVIATPALALEVELHRLRLSLDKYSDAMVALADGYFSPASHWVSAAAEGFLGSVLDTRAGRTDAAMAPFDSRQIGTRHPESDASSLRVTMLGADVAQFHVPFMFTIAAAGQSTARTRFLMNQVPVETDAGWRPSGSLPILAPAE